MVEIYHKSNQCIDITDHMELNIPIETLDAMMLAVAGPSAAGKSTLAKKLAERLRKSGNTVSLFRFDDYMIDRDKRKGSGSIPTNIEFPRLIDDLESLYFYKDPIQVFPYSHALGKKISAIETIMPANVVIVDGSLSLMNSFVEYFRPFGIFIQPDENEMNRMKVQENMKHRGYGFSKAAQNTIDDYYAYLNYIKPTKKNATIVVDLKVNTNGERTYSML